jgi:DNA-directed RNA polymerase specialized sigma24 family protein
MSLAACSEAELLALMARQATAGDLARSAWGELFVRHRRYLYMIAARSYGSFLGEDGTTDLVVDTFRRAFEWAGRQLNPDMVVVQFTGGSPDGTRRRVLGWLGAIAERLFRDRFRDHALEAEKHDQFTAEWLSRQDAEPETADSAPLAALRDALATLSLADAAALQVSLPWYDPATRAFAVPRGEAARIAALLGITTEALRQRRHRAIQRLEVHLHAAGIAMPSKEASE